MEQKKVLKAIIAIISVTVVIIAGLIVYSKVKESKENLYSVSAYSGKLNLASLYKEGRILKTDDELEIKDGSCLTNASDDNTYVIKLAYIDFGKTPADKVIINAGTLHDSDAVLRLYKGNSKKPFLETDISEDDEADAISDERIFDISDAKIKGKKMIRIEIEFKDDEDDGLFELESLEFKSADIPTLYFNVDEDKGTIEDMNRSKKNSCSGSVEISVPSGYKSEYKGKNTDGVKYEVKDIHGRGNSTWDCDKKSYVMKLSSKEDLFGMGSAKKWLLLANYYDKSLMRDKLAYNLACDMGMEYAIQSVFVDVVMNDRYIGSYLLTEKIEVKKNRVDIKDLDDYPDEKSEKIINGGYLIQLKPIDRAKDDNAYFYADYVEKAMVIESPSFDNGINEAQFNYIEDYYHRFEEAVESYDFTNSYGERYTDLIDIDSLVDFFLVHEIFKNNDALYASTYFYKDRDSKMKIGPVWDLDLSAGTYACNDTEYPEGFFLTGQYIFSSLIYDPDFTERVEKRYWEIHDDITKMYLSDKDNKSEIEQYADMLDISQKMNFDKWGMGNRGWDAVLGQGSYEKEVDYLADWLEKRINWLDENIGTLNIQ